MARTIFVGDVHGCADELAELLSVLALGEGDDLVFVGDLVARGPSSRGVVRMARESGARGVLGNHEWRLLELWRARLAGKPVKARPRQEALLRELLDEDFGYLAGLPLYLDLPAHAARVVHAGVVPGLPLAEHDAWTLTHMRSVGADGKPSADPGSEPWGAGYRGAPHVVFGHDARRGLQLHPAATGIDTACVYGGSLTALVLEPGEAVPFPRDRRDRLVSVRARRAYFTGET